MAVEINCPICFDSLLGSFDEFEREKIVCSLECGHVFHDCCMQQLQDVRNKESLSINCPSCNAKLQEYFVAGESTIDRHRLYITYDENADNWTKGARWSRSAVLGTKATDVMRLAEEMDDANVTLNMQTVELVKDLKDIGDQLEQKKRTVKESLVMLGGLKDTIGTIYAELIEVKAGNTLQEKMEVLISSMIRSTASVSSACKRIRLAEPWALVLRKATSDLADLQEAAKVERVEHHRVCEELRDTLLKRTGERDSARRRERKLLWEQCATLRKLDEAGSKIQELTNKERQIIIERDFSLMQLREALAQQAKTIQIRDYTLRQVKELVERPPTASSCDAAIYNGPQGTNGPAETQTVQTRLIASRNETKQCTRLESEVKELKEHITKRDETIRQILGMDGDGQKEEPLDSAFGALSLATSSTLTPFSVPIHLRTQQPNFLNFRAPTPPKKSNKSRRKHRPRLSNTNNDPFRAFSRGKSTIDWTMRAENKRSFEVDIENDNSTVGLALPPKKYKADGAVNALA